MLITEFLKNTGLTNPGFKCQECKDTDAVIEMHGYCEGPSIYLCSDCALQLVRKLTEDLCALLTKGGRHG